jgi:hypothetical protein
MTTTTLTSLEQAEALEVIESLRKGIPPKRYTSSYTAGTEDFLKKVRSFHLQGASTRGKLRFVSGSWGEGKTHLLRLLREEAFDANYLVSTVELNADSTPFNKFEQVFYDIVRNITSPEMYRDGQLDLAAPFGEVLRRALLQGPGEPDATVSHERLQEAKDKLFGADGIDIDFRRVTSQYWETFLPDGGDVPSLENARGRLLQWFAGEGTMALYRKLGIQKIVNRSNARLMLQSLSRLATHIGYRGLVILFDEAEMSYSTMRKSNLKQAHNNLLHLINSIDQTEGLFLIYATTPDFYMDERHGITIYGALAQRIGKPEERSPRPLDRIWNLDRVESSLNDHLNAACKIRSIYITAYPEFTEAVPSEAELRDYARKLVEAHPEFSRISKWRVLVSGTVEVLDTKVQGEDLPPAEQLHDDIMEKFRNQ